MGDRRRHCLTASPSFRSSGLPWLAGPCLTPASLSVAPSPPALIAPLHTILVVPCTLGLPALSLCPLAPVRRNVASWPLGIRPFGILGAPLPAHCVPHSPGRLPPCWRGCSETRSSRMISGHVRRSSDRQASRIETPTKRRIGAGTCDVSRSCCPFIWGRTLSAALPRSCSCGCTVPADAAGDLRRAVSAWHVRVGTEQSRVSGWALAAWEARKHRSAPAPG